MSTQTPSDSFPVQTRFPYYAKMPPGPFPAPRAHTAQWSKSTTPEPCMAIGPGSISIQHQPCLLSVDSSLMVRNASRRGSPLVEEIGGNCALCTKRKAPESGAQHGSSRRISEESDHRNPQPCIHDLCRFDRHHSAAELATKCSQNQDVSFSATSRPAHSPDGKHWLAELKSGTTGIRYRRAHQSNIGDTDTDLIPTRRGLILRH